MRKNLLIGCVGPTSLHQQWISGVDRSFDLMLVHYGDSDRYKDDGEYYIRAKGTKFNIIGDIFDQIPKEYEYVFIPDDDLYMSSGDIDRLFEIAREYKLKICQPSLVGYYSTTINVNHPGNILRYTDYVEIIGPCFDRETFEACRHTFNHNKSCWGIDLLWGVVLQHPKNAIAVVDDVIAIHTRPCYWGDNYSNNKISEPGKDMEKIVEENGLSWERVVYSSVKKEGEWKLNSEERIYPKIESMKQICSQVGKQRFSFV
jgi:hypothetical protein